MKRFMNIVVASVAILVAAMASNVCLAGDPSHGGKSNHGRSNNGHHNGHGNQFHKNNHNFHHNNFHHQNNFGHGNFGNGHFGFSGVPSHNQHFKPSSTGWGAWYFGR